MDYLKQKTKTHQIKQYQYIKYKLDGETKVSLADTYNSSTGRIELMSGQMSSGNSEDHTIQFWLSDDAPNDMIGNVLSLKINLEATAGKDRNFAKFIGCKYFVVVFVK